METILITGANRGIGLEFTRQYAATPETQVFATCRQPDHEDAADLHTLAEAHDNLTVLKLDVTQPDDITSAAQTIAEQADALSLLINNAALVTLPPEKQFLGNLTQDDLLNHMNINYVGPVLMVQAFLDLLKKAENPRIINITSWMGCLTQRTMPGLLYGYCPSKSALNMVTRGLTADLADDGIKVLALDPGSVQTRGGGRDAPLTPEESVTAMRGIIADLVTDGDLNGVFINQARHQHPW